nr:immunoglobulin heavy chain junction region [Macaca mulatta]MOX64463.1 immunoglobulin heavy chain junction region [Macaca mulatta]MOX66729.1 immunoglobulin heavy chain junction region [Macaca mulatta]MOX68006.1 immunoglobulin heavy chain junction region [Macaca mulatta]
CTTSSWGDDFW